MTKKRGRPPRDAVATREIILDAALNALARNGPEALTFADVSRVAKLNRATPYQYFETREQLIEAAMDRASTMLIEKVFGSADAADSLPLTSDELIGMNNRLLEVSLANPAICRAWLFSLLTSNDASRDPFWRSYEGFCARFAKSEMAREGLDPQVLAMILISSFFLWPIWMNVLGQSEEDRRELAARFTNECLRLSLYGSLRPEHFPEMAALVKRNLHLGPAAGPDE